MHQRRMLVALAIGAVVCVSAAAQQRWDFSGEWVLNRAASLLQGETAAVESSVLRIEHREPSFSFARTLVVQQQSFDARYVIQTDGREVAGGQNGQTSRSRLEWQGNSLVLTALIRGPRGEVSNVVRYELLDGGHTLRAIEDLGGAAPPHHNVWMFERR
jgi:hypothetical protein